MADPTITTEQLEAITGLKKSELLTMTRFGIIPKAEKGQWPLAKTIRGIIADLKDSSLPGIYSSIANCAATTGIPAQVIRAAKRSDCPAFEGSRVRLKPLLEWLCSKKDSAINFDAIIKEERGKLLRAQRLLAEGKSIDKATVQEELAAMVEHFRDTLIRTLVEELPMKLEGFRAAQIAQKMETVVDGLLETLNNVPHAAPELPGHTSQAA